MKLVSIILCLCVGQAISELFQNGDFESNQFSGNWQCNSCNLSLTNDHVNGQHSGKVTQRHATWAGIRYDVHVTTGKKYVIKGFIKLLNKAPGSMYHRVQVMINGDAQGHTHYFTVSEDRHVQQEFGWTEIGGDFMLTTRGLNRITIYVQVDNKDVNYLIDSMSLKELPTDSDWKSEANARIETIRKSDINVQITNGHGIDTSNLQIELKQTKNAFAFGTAINADAIHDPAQTGYQDFFYNNFEWAVIENALKWRLMEWTQGHANFDRPMAAINAMRSRGIKIRGHNMYWAADQSVPKWLSPMSEQQLLQAMHTHLNDMISHTRGKLEHWDVNNEDIHGNYFARHLDNPNITQDMFQWMHQAEPGVKLFLNDFNVVSSHFSTTAYKEHVRRFKDAGMPIYGAGIQSHFKTSNQDMTTVEYRLNKIAETGLPLWITELTVDDHNEANKADQLENLLTLYFSHPLVEGVLLWGYSDLHVYSQGIALAHGPNCTPNAAGTRYQQLYRKWRTNMTSSLHNQTIRGFKGDYTLLITSHGNTIETKSFTLTDATTTVSVHLSGSASHVHSSTVIT
ncbi:anti-sigma-I factor RsgI6-like [Pecten maximus]|uniref:anti-sigma-I factor RsgI6-like n=1 Tax=Pecten maximus TaxID=6579 RepID=UPI0014582750|nr:anti-sigma-I factor RsgI6-like [Pecten maximus]